MGCLEMDQMCAQYDGTALVSRSTNQFKIFLVGIDADWGSPSSSQYHIQTDEGPERFFRYQTDSGQFRNEKRLKDGTVIGTEAWIDALGYLRSKDYIADKDGFRILKSKTLFVGINRPIKDVISNGRINSKFNSPTTYRPVANAIDNDDFGYGKAKTPEILVHYNAEPIDGRHGYIPPSTTVSPPVTTYRPVFSTSVLPLSSSTPATVSQTYISSTTPLPLSSSSFAPVSSTIATPPQYFLPPIDESEDARVVEIRPTSAPPLIRPIAAYTADQVNQELFAPSGELRVPLERYSTTATPINDVTATPIAIVSTESPNSVIPRDRPLFDRNAFYRRRQNAYYSSTNQIDSGGTTNQFDRYDAQRPNGFAYFLPRQYHEETFSRDATNRDGSFGYIDPFGIRRVVYYRTGPDGGFKVRKNNRYVGFNAKPYDSK